ncbi:hypothetical protein N7509_010347 [Penicillium cosmopolitanum]|uniref:Uncharacterized protein n=1 Tax=Penicillium cosmopolitanum TaxID=1131564 RepID=A0A9W9VR47_9EURO|nr:uncharacterized protein N7509_010347 [Penicillium cosmopolitanum]KAJ5387806.1 hypothetical protein N7509_010347 [Penicillium cosmopolitanum]
MPVEKFVHVFQALRNLGRRHKGGSLRSLPRPEPGRDPPLTTGRGSGVVSAIVMVDQDGRNALLVQPGSGPKNHDPDTEAKRESKSQFRGKKR